MARRLVGFCFALLLAVALLYTAVWLLGQFWGWLLLIAGVTASLYVGIAVVRWWRNRW